MNDHDHQGEGPPSLEARRSLLEGSDFHPEPGQEAWEQWHQARAFIADAINQDGDVLDVGCANGLLLTSLIQWSPDHQLVPYGIDTRADRVKEADGPLASRGGRAALLPMAELARLGEVGLPEAYDLIYWNVWDNVSFAEPVWRERLAELASHLKPGGRLILGFYDSDPHQSSARIIRLAEHGVQIAGTHKNPAGPERLAWIDAPNHSS
ncbi:methyltransferase domain-containing protein [Candidatus Berkelbacteria bacterium]|nr:methyltransferase domain-containing protein [Candidatus Berkelbacteria bacterium]